MTIKTLWTGNGVSRSLHYAEGMIDSGCVRIFADAGKGITDGNIVTEAVDRPREDIDKWTDCERPPELEDEETGIADYQQALNELVVNTE